MAKPKNLNTNHDKFHEPKHFHVAIFGSARIRKNDPNYNRVYTLARLIAEEGMDIITGGGPGLMEAANKGHQEGRQNDDVHSLGLNIKLSKEQIANQHLDLKTEFKRFSGRLDTFMELSNAVVIAPGGVGTLLEFFYTWQLVQVRQICSIPIILLGDQWDDLIEWLKKWPLKEGYIDDQDLKMIFYAKTVKNAMDVIRMANTAFKMGGKDFCLNYKKYSLHNF